MRVLITGASGFVGGRLIAYLRESGDLQLRAASRIVRTWPEGVEGCVIDIARPATLRDACREMDAVINLSSMAERFCSIDPQIALRVNAGGTLALVLAAASAGVSRFVQVSTSKVYGNNPGGLLTEETPCKPQSPYAVTHRAAEDYVTSQHPKGVVFRLANGFGAPIDAGVNCWNLIVNEMCRQAAVERRITIRSSGQAWRNFVPMHDVVRALQAAATGLPHGTYNLGSSQSMQLRSVAERVAQVCREMLGFSPSVNTTAAVEGEQTVPLDYRIEKLARAGFKPTASFDEEVGRTLLAAQGAFGGKTRG
jgi:UDP-glucose 4-epimerase